MKTRLYIFILFSIFSVSLFAFGNAEDVENKVVVYAYDSFISEWGPGPEIAKLFKEETGYDVDFVSCEDGGSVLARAISEKAAPNADILIGIDNFLLPKARKADILVPYKSNSASNLLPETILTDDFLLTPFDFGYFTIMFDSKSKKNPPKKLIDLVNSEYLKTLVIMDPRTSTPGIGFVAWTKAVFGNEYLNFWKKIKPTIFAMTPGWSAGYGLFTFGEAPFVISYTTSEAYHILYDKTDRFKALELDDGHIMQIEGIGLVKGAKHEKAAKSFIDFMLSKKAQTVLPEKQFMYPVVKNIELPASFKELPIPKKLLKINIDFDKTVSEVLDTLQYKK